MYGASSAVHIGSGRRPLEIVVQTPLRVSFIIAHASGVRFQIRSKSISKRPSYGTMREFKNVSGGRLWFKLKLSILQFFYYQ